MMTEDPAACLPEDKLNDAARLMWENDCGAIPVVKDEESREVVGIVTDRDIAMHVTAHDLQPSNAKVMDCMSSPAITCDADTAIGEVMKTMAGKQIRRIPIVDENGGCLGIISQADILIHANEIDELKPIVTTLQEISTRRGPRNGTIRAIQKAVVSGESTGEHNVQQAE
jgi:CBS domain-containing protein